MSQHCCWIVWESYKVSSGETGIYLNHFKGITLLVLFLFCKLTKMYGRILHLFLKGEGRKGSSGKHWKRNVWEAESGGCHCPCYFCSSPCLLPGALICVRSISLTPFFLQIPFLHQAVSVSILRIQSINFCLYSNLKVFYIILLLQVWFPMSVSESLSRFP